MWFVQKWQKPPLNFFFYVLILLMSVVFAEFIIRDILGTILSLIIDNSPTFEHYFYYSLELWFLIKIYLGYIITYLGECSKFFYCWADTIYHLYTFLRQFSWYWRFFFNFFVNFILFLLHQVLWLFTPEQYELVGYFFYTDISDIEYFNNNLFQIIFEDSFMAIYKVIPLKILVFFLIFRSGKGFLKFREGFLYNYDRINSEFGAKMARLDKACEDSIDPKKIKEALIKQEQELAWARSRKETEDARREKKKRRWWRRWWRRLRYGKN